MTESAGQNAAPAPPAARAGGLSLALYAATLFVGALLLFAVQPMFTKAVLPLLGGSPAVWNTALVFFQAALLAGYVYAHLVSRYLGPKAQPLLHMALLGAAFAVLPIALAAGWTAPGQAPPIPWLIGLLSVSIGLPFFAVSATAPLMQKWFAGSGHAAAADPYFLYGISNLGGLMALIGYPIVIEPLFGLALQGWMWTWGYALLVALIAVCAVASWRTREAARPTPESEAESGLVSEMGWRQRLHWLLLAFAPSSLLLGVTLHISTDVAAAPFVWVVPLALYLLSFTLVFARRQVLRHGWMVGLQTWVLIALALYFGINRLWLIFPLHLLALFVCAMVCHGELARRRPVTRHLTEYYLWIPIGGLLGGVFSALVAPLVFDRVIEYPLALVLACLLRPAPGASPTWRKGLDLALPAGLALLYLSLEGKLGIELSDLWHWRRLLLAAMMAAVLLTFRKRPLGFALGVAVLLLAPPLLPGPRQTLLTERSFFGIHRVEIGSDPRFHLLWNGTTLHGVENTLPDYRRLPLTYFTPRGPLGQVFRALNGSGQIERIGVVGLGAGTVACYLEPGQTMTFYEIDPVVERLARDERFFHYLSECGADADVVLGDGRINLAEAPDGAYDLLVLDAFSSDAVPVHLLTREALALYMRKLAPGGLVMFQITNIFVDLDPVLANLVDDAGLAGRIQYHLPLVEFSRPSRPTYDLRSTWVVVARTAADLEVLGHGPRWRPLRPEPIVGLWTDDFSNVALAVVWKQLITLRWTR
ncbi:MAG: fused MFS/spermidine synthase [Alphaproteobacteria bacterium]|nr:fused MFS/spermidine synthase [Alphaproteobacteria bacterium]